MKLDVLRASVFNEDGSIIKGETLIDNRLLAAVVNKLDDCRACPVLAAALRQQLDAAIEIGELLAVSDTE